MWVILVALFDKWWIFSDRKKYNEIFDTWLCRQLANKPWSAILFGVVFSGMFRALVIVDVDVSSFKIWQWETAKLWGTMTVYDLHPSFWFFVTVETIVVQGFLKRLPVRWFFIHKVIKIPSHYYSDFCCIEQSKRGEFIAFFEDGGLFRISIQFWFIIEYWLILCFLIISVR